MAFPIFLSAIFVFMCLHQVQAHGSGAPISQCETMVPGHWITPQSTPSPFSVTSDRVHVAPNEEVHITLKSDGETPFKGFLIMVRKEGQNDTNVGTFTFVDKGQTINCFKNFKSAVTHQNNDLKTSVNLIWKAPANGMEEEYTILATFVQDFWNIWAQVPSKQKISIKRSADIVFKDADMTQDLGKSDLKLNKTSTTDSSGTGTSSPPLTTDENKFTVQGVLKYLWSLIG